MNTTFERAERGTAPSSEEVDGVGGVEGLYTGLEGRTCSALGDRGGNDCTEIVLARRWSKLLVGLWDDAGIESLKLRAEVLPMERGAGIECEAIPFIVKETEARSAEGFKGLSNPLDVPVDE
jgi:hypothetical protein